MACVIFSQAEQFLKSFESIKLDQIQVINNAVLPSE